MRIWCLGANYKTAPLEIRGKLSLNSEYIAETVKKITLSASINEAVILSTCNRSEIYCIANNLFPIIRPLLANGINLDDLRSYTYTYSDYQAVAQLLRVASGVDSMVLGESEIFGQLKQAYGQAMYAGSVHKYLSKLFQKTFAVAKVIRAKTGIGLHPLSVTSIVVKLANQLFSDFDKITVMLLGAGDTSEQLLKQLHSAGAKNFIVANRTVAKAQAMADALGLSNSVICIPLTLVRQYLADVDIVIGATKSPLPIIGKGMVEQALQQRRYRPMCFVDIAVPRDIEPEIGQLAEVYLYSIDDLQKIVAKHRDSRSMAAKQAEVIIKEEAEKFMQWYYAENHNKALVDFRLGFELKKQNVTKRALQQLEAGVSAQQIIAKITHQLSQHFLHVPTKAIKNASLRGDTDTLEAIEKIFQLSE